MELFQNVLLVAELLHDVLLVVLLVLGDPEIKLEVQDAAEVVHSVEDDGLEVQDAPEVIHSVEEVGLVVQGAAEVAHGHGAAAEPPAKVGDTK